MKSLPVLMLSLYVLLAGPVLALDEPRLSIINVPPNFVISWPDLPLWNLEQSPHLMPPVPWSLVAPELYQSSLGLRFVSIPSEETNRFFRLRKENRLIVPGLTGYWPLDEGTGASSVDGSSSGASMSLANVSWSSGRFGPGALQFNGGTGQNASRAWISNENYRALPASGQPFSLSLWFNPDDLAMGWRGIAGNYVSGSNGWSVGLNSTGPGTNYLVFASAGTANSLSVTGRMLLLPAQWHQLTVTHDGIAGSIYVGSALLGTSAGSVLMDDRPIYFGGGVAGFDSFLGRMDDVRLYTNCLSQEATSLTGYWRFDENLGVDAADSSIQGHPASVTSASAWAGGHNGSGVRLGTAQVVIRNEDYAVLPASGGSFSISFWLRPEALNSEWSGLMNCGTENLNGWSMALESQANQTLLRFCSTNRGGTLDLITPLPLIQGAWTKLEITYNGGIATVYANGKKMGEKSGAIRGSKAPLMVGGVPGMQNFTGVFDELRIYNRERGAAEIGPIAATMWEMAMMNTVTNLQLQGDGPGARALTYAIVPSITPTNGTVEVNPSSGIISYTAGSRKGPDAFTYTVSDGEFTSDPAIVTMSVVQPHWLSTNGGATGPLDGSTPANAWAANSADALDAIWKTNNYYDCFFYGPGEFQTRGWKYLERSTANPGCKHIGSGSKGTEQTTLRLVDIWSSWGEATFFSTLSGELCDNFEVHHLVLDCNAVNVPKYAKGEPVVLRIPLTSTTRVDSVTLRWDNTVLQNGYWHFGRATDFSLWASNGAANTFTANYTNFTPANQIYNLAVGAEADELILEFDRRAAGIDFYALAEIEVTGGTVSIPTAKKTDGSESRLNLEYSIVSAVDDNSATSWASGPENQVEIILPLAHGTSVSQINFEWNCKVIPGTGRLGPASGYTIRARDEVSGQFYDVPFLRNGRTAAGQETVTFGTALVTNVIATDQLSILLTAKEAAIDFYSLKEIRLQNGQNPVSWRLPTASSSLNSGFAILRAFDKNTGTQWACGTQGMLGAADVGGNNLKFCDLKVVGFGTKAARECFALFVVPRSFVGPGHFGNVLVQDCVFTEPAPYNSDGITTLVLANSPPNTLTNAVVRRVTVAGLSTHFSYSVGMGAKHVEDCLVQECGRGVYFEPDKNSSDRVGSVIVRSNQFVNVIDGVYLYMHADSRFDSITCAGNEIVLSALGGWGLAACDACDAGQSGVIANVTALNNIIRYAGWIPNRTSYEGGIQYSDIQQAVFGNNVIALGNANASRVRQYPAGVIFASVPEEDCDHPGPFPPGTPSYPASMDALRNGYQRAWFNNRDLSGTTLQVRFFNFGVDGLASEQQWGE